MPQRQRVAAAAGVLALLLYCLAPFAPAVPATAGLVQICTAHGIVWVTLPDADGSPPPAGMPDCPACALTVHAGGPTQAVLSAMAAPLRPDNGGTPRLRPPATAPSVPSDVATAQPRGPPLLA